jgi:hypothetical protein
MNNYFGIGLDAKISLDFQNKREELKLFHERTGEKQHISPRRDET